MLLAQGLSLGPMQGFLGPLPTLHSIVGRNCLHPYLRPHPLHSRDGGLGIGGLVLLVTPWAASYSPLFFTEVSLHL